MSDVLEELTLSEIKDSNKVTIVKEEPLKAKEYDPNSIYTEKEQATLELIEEYSLNTLKNIYKEGVPETSNMIRVAKEFMTEMSNRIQKNAELRLKQTEVNNQKSESEQKQMIIDILKEQADRRNSMPKRSNIEEVIVQEELVIEKPTFVPDEDSSYKELQIEDFTDINTKE